MTRVTTQQRRLPEARRLAPRAPTRSLTGLRLWPAALLILLWGFFVAAGEPDVTPLTNVHAHNDYEHTRPLFDALAQGFCSVEADIYNLEGKLLVAHERSQVKPERTLESLYLEPLRQRVRSNGGRVYRGGPPVFLLIDVKTSAEPTYQVLREVLAHYADMLTVFRGTNVETKAVTVVISGNRPRQALPSEPVRYAALDGLISDLEGGSSAALIPWISENWSSHFKWRGWQEMPAEEQQKLRQIVNRAHQQGRLVRFWGGPDTPALWRAQWMAGVDLINTDHLAELRAFLLDPKNARPH